METKYFTIRVDFEGDISAEELGEIVCARANAHNGTIENGLKISNVEFCGENGRIDKVESFTTIIVY